MKSHTTKIVEIDEEFSAVMKQVNELEKKILKLKVEKKTPKAHLYLQELIADCKEILIKHTEELEDLNMVYEQRIGTLK